MQVLALNSSPRTNGESKTELMLNYLVSGMRAAGADVEVVNLRKKKINFCAGCFTCWTKSPGVCLHKDDMSREIFPKWLQSDLVVYASPLYHFTVNAVMKAFIERTLPILQPFFLGQDGRTSHPLRQQHPKLVMLSVAGFPENSVFDQLSSWINFIFSGAHRAENTLVAEIYRPMAEALTNPYLKDVAADILEATVQAGRELAANMNVSEETMARVTQPMVEDYANFMEIGNLIWKTCIAEGVTPKEFTQKGMVPRPDSIDSYLKVMSLGFNAAAAGDVKATIQFNFSGEQQGACYIAISEGIINCQQGAAAKPDLTVTTPFEVWMDILTRKADGQQMLMEQRYQTEGDISLLLQMGELFGADR